MSCEERLNKLLSYSKEIKFNNTSKIILMSDCHRGNNTWADDFARNENMYFAALNFYYNEGFTYIELGDGDDLWQFGDYAEIKQAHNQTFQLLRKFYAEGRMYMIWGNHDALKQSYAYVQKNLYYFNNPLTGEQESLFEKIKVYEALKLKHEESSNTIFLLHGHQVDGLWGNNYLTNINKYVMRFIWKPLEIYFGFKDPTSPAKNYTKRNSVENKLINWVKKKKQITIAGHTHKPVFPSKNAVPYFNTGSSVHPRCITGLEIAAGKICLIKWLVHVKDDGTLFIVREIIAGPQKLSDFFPKK